MPAAIKLASFWQKRRKCGQLCAKLDYISSSFGFWNIFGMLMYIWDRSQLPTKPRPRRVWSEYVDACYKVGKFQAREAKILATWCKRMISIPGRLTFHSMVHNSTDCSCCMAKVVAKIRCIEWGWANRRKGKHKQRKFWSQPSKLDGRAHNSCLYQRRREEKRNEENPRNIKKE